MTSLRVTPLPGFRRSFHLVRVGERPLLAFPCESRDVRLAALGCYPTHSWKRKLVRSAMQIAEWTGVGRWLWQTVPSPLSEIDPLALAMWLETLGDQIQEPDLQPVFVWPADAQRGRVYVHLLGQSAAPIAFVKLALDRPNSDLIRNEQRALEKLATIPRRKVRIPKVLGSGAIRGHAYLTVECAPRQARIVNWKTDTEADELVREYAGEPWNIPLAEIEKLPWWRSFVQEATPGLEFLAAVRVAAADGVDVCRVHGDINRTNVLRCGEGIWLLDWERSCETGPYLTDLICAEVDRLWSLAQRNVSLALEHFRAAHWDNREQRYRRGVLLALAFLYAAEFTPAIVLVRRWQFSE